MRSVTPLFVVAVLALAPAAAAKELVKVVVVGANGGSAEVGPERGVVATLFYHPQSVYDVKPRPARPRGGYVRVYPLGRGGAPATPGRFYPTTSAICFDWNQARPPLACWRPAPTPVRLRATARRLTPFHGSPTTVADLRPGDGFGNLRVVIELAFDRFRAARRAPRPHRCLPFRATWRGPRAAQRPAEFCVSPFGVYARGRLYPAGAAAWQFAQATS